MAGRRTRALILVAFTLSLLILLAGVLNRASAQEAPKPAPDKGAEQGSTTTVSDSLVTRGPGASAPLVVPVYPQGGDKAKLPKGADLRDSYVVMKDGSVVSVADWILGALAHDKHGMAMSDYENRLFLGQVARALVGEDEHMVDRAPVPHPVAGLAERAGLGPMRIGPFSIDTGPIGGNKLLQSGPPRGIYSLNDAIGTSFTDEISIGKLQLLEDPYSTAFADAIEDYKLRGTFLNMLHDYEKYESKGQ